MGRPSFQKGKLRKKRKQDSIPMADYSRDHNRKSAAIGSLKRLTGTATSHGRTVLHICGQVLSCFSLLVPPVMQPLGVGSSWVGVLIHSLFESEAVQLSRGATTWPRGSR